MTAPAGKAVVVTGAGVPSLILTSTPRWWRRPDTSDPKFASSERMQQCLAAFGHAVGVINALIARRRAKPEDNLVGHLVDPEFGLTDEGGLLDHLHPARIALNSCVTSRCPNSQLLDVTK